MTTERAEAECDDSPWTPDETSLLAGIAFGQLDDTDYSALLTDVGSSRGDDI